MTRMRASWEKDRSEQVEAIRSAMAARIVREINSWGLTQAEAALRMGSTQTEVSQILRGSLIASIDKLLILSAKAGIVITVSIPE